MKYASIVNRIAAPADAEGDPWEVHEIASKRSDAGEDIVLLSIGQEADETTPAAIVKEAVRSLNAGDHHYTDVQGTPALLDCIATYHKELTGQSVTAENCTAYAGAQNALFAAAQVLLETGDEVILTEPYYTTYAATFTASGATPVSVPVTKSNGYQLNTNDIAAAVTTNTRVIVLNSPNNPMGSCYSATDFSTIMSLCVKYKIWLILDAVYLGIVENDRSTFPHACDGAEELLITVCSLSKSHRMTGWRIGWVVAPKELSNHLANLSMCMHYGLPPFIMKAAQVAIAESSSTPTTVQKTLARRRRIATPLLQKMQGATLHDSGQGMFMLIDVSDLGVSARTFSLALLDEHGVAVLPCDGFGAAGANLVRVGLCVDDEKLERACEKIVRCVAAFTSKN